MTTQLLLVRHARSVIPTPGGPAELHRPLTDDGVRDAEALAARLLDCGATAALRALAGEHLTGTAVVGSHGTFIARALAGLGHPVDVDFWLGRPMPAVYRVAICADRRRSHPTVDIYGEAFEHLF